MKKSDEFQIELQSMTIAQPMLYDFAQKVIKELKAVERERDEWHETVDWMVGQNRETYSAKRHVSDMSDLRDTLNKETARAWDWARQLESALRSIINLEDDNDAFGLEWHTEWKNAIKLAKLVIGPVWLEKQGR